MGKLRCWLRDWPLPGAAVLTALFVGLGLLIGNLPMPMTGGYVWLIAVEVLEVFWPLGLVLLCGYGWTYVRGGFFRTLRAGAVYLIMEGFLLAVTLAALVTGEAPNPVSWTYGAFLAAFALGVGFREESLFRGVIVNLLAQRYARSRAGIWGTVVASGAFFGLVHLGNVFAGINLSSALVQSATAWALGCTMCAIYLRGGSLWALILLHGLTDAASMLYAAAFAGNDVLEAIDSLGVENLTPILPFTLLTVYLLRNSKCDEILARFGETALPDSLPEPPAYGASDGEETQHEV